MRALSWRPLAAAPATLGLLALAALALGPASGTPVAAEPLRIVAATTDLGAIARAVGGEHVAIDVVARPDRDPHSLEIRPSTMRKTARADLYLEVGLSLDLWSEGIVRGSRNRDLVTVDCSEAIVPLEVPAGPVDASQGDVHPEGNPHYWLDPENGVAVGRHLAKHLAVLDPERAELYRANAEAFAERVHERLPGWEARLRGRSFVEYHRSWVYLAERFGVRIAGQVEPLPGIPPTARHLAALAETIRAEEVPIVIRSPYHAGSPLEFLARETGVRTVVIPSSCGEPTPESYLDLFDTVALVLGGAARSGAADGDAQSAAGRGG
jgi:zinc/manganese transport system substrate-binding protein